MEAGRKRGRALAVPAALLSLLAAGCGTMSLPEADLRIVNGSEPESLDPIRPTRQSDFRIVSALFEGLTRYDARTGDPEPGLAERWTLDPERRIYRFHLREGLRWSDGSPLGAGDVAYSWRRVLEPENLCRNARMLHCIRGARDYYLGRVSDFSQVGIRAVSERELVVELESPTPWFLDICAFPSFRVVPRDRIERHGERWMLQEDLCTSGAYTLDFWRIGDRVRLKRNPRYWDAGATRSRVVDFLPVSNPSVALNLFETGVVDIVWDRKLIPSQLVPVLRERPDFHVSDSLQVYFLRVRAEEEPWSDPRVRLALSLAVDRKRIVEQITRGGEQPAAQLVPPRIGGYRPPRGISHDPGRARELLARAGYPGGRGLPRIDYLMDSSRLNEQIAVELQSMWRETLGAETTLRRLESKSYLGEQKARRYDVSQSSWVGDFPDPVNFLEIFQTGHGNNRTGWGHPRYDALLREAAAARDGARRMELLARAEELLVEEEAPVIPIFFYVAMERYDKRRISGITPNLMAFHPVRAIARSPGEPEGR